MRAADGMSRPWDPTRRSYSGLMRLPAFGLYREDCLVATVRAKTAPDAREIFKRHELGQQGDRVRRIP